MNFGETRASDELRLNLSVGHFASLRIIINPRTVGVEIESTLYVHMWMRSLHGRLLLLAKTQLMNREFTQ